MSSFCAISREASLNRLATTVIGAALFASALGLWLLPGSSWSGEMLLMKLGLTATFLIAGFAALMWPGSSSVHDTV